MNLPTVSRRVALSGSVATPLLAASRSADASGASNGGATKLTASTGYDASGVYLDYLSRSNIAGGSNVRLDSNGVITVKNGSTFVYNPTTIAQYGLQQYSYYVRDRTSAALHSAVVQAGWLVSHQNSGTGAWTYSYPFGVGGMNETLPAGWSSAMAQGQAMSLLTRVYRSYPTKTAYLAAAKKALAPLLIPVSAGGLAATFQGATYLEEYPTKSAPTLALNGFMFTLIGLYDLGQTGSSPALTLLDTCMAALRAVLPNHDMVTTSAYHLGHLTKPPRPVHHAAHYHRVHVTELDALRSVLPDPTLDFYANLWRGYPDMDPTTWAVPRQLGGTEISGLG